ncbi:hypothetical protein JOE32_003588 [Pseudomonas sp. PvP025]|nr:hypothetical protein [Pseudomonas sp. PvP025]MDQ0400981.1 hypothetical protein [Pseudomonas sp. PvP006]
MKNSSAVAQPLSSMTLRLIAALIVLFMSVIGVFSLYWIWEHVIPIYGRIYRGAPIVETPYLAFCLLMAPPAALISVVGASICVWTGKKFDPPKNSFLYRFQSLMIYLSIKTVVYAVPTIMIITTSVLLLRNYSPCPKLLISGSAWQLFWVNDERACFKPTRYINDNWPCKMIGDQEVCFRSDGR